MLSTWFAHPALLWTLLALPAAMAFLLFAFFRRQQLTARLGNRMLLRKSVRVNAGVRRCRTICFLIVLGLIALACAGPQWGLDKSAQPRKGRDVILVLDLSRSMSAEHPSRREIAVRALRHVADTFEEHGGNRIALVAFASRTRLLFPLTHDCDHLRHVIAQVEADDIPKLSVPEPVSGTRIGAALKLAAESFDPARANRPIIVLLSDGDDPADDDEYLEGVSAVIEKRLRIHTVGIGNPRKAESIPAGREVLQFEDKPILTRLNEPRLREIASRTEGVYLPAHNETLPLGTFLLHLLDADELREELPTGAELPVYQLRYAWFLLPAVVLFMLTLLLNEGPPTPRKAYKAPRPSSAQRPRFTHARAKATAAFFAAVAILNVSAADPPAAESLIRQGNDAFAHQEYADALRFYEQAETLTLDPGRLSFNKAAAYFRLGQHREAIECYRRSLQDDQAPPERRARAFFDLGNALLQYADDSPHTLAEAVVSFRACLHQPQLTAKLQADARHNLELAQLLWLKAKNNQPEDKPTPPTKPKDPGSKDEKGSDQSDPRYVPVDPAKGDRVEKAGHLTPKKKSDNLSGGRITALEDKEQPQPLRPEDTLATLAEHARRIAAARRAQRNPGGPASLSTKDW